MKKKIIQLLLLERQRAGTVIAKVRATFESGNHPDSGTEAALNISMSRIQTLLWVLRELDPEQFTSTIENLGFRADDEEVKAVAELDELIEKFGDIAGDWAAIANEWREREEGAR